MMMFVILYNMMTLSQLMITLLDLYTSCCDEVPLFQVY